MKLILPGLSLSVAESFAEDDRKENPNDNIYTALKSAKTINRGKGFSYALDIEPHKAMQLAEHMMNYGEDLRDGFGDPEARPEGRALVAAADKIRQALKQEGVPTRWQIRHSVAYLIKEVKDETDL